MARLSEPLDAGAAFPRIELPTVAHDALVLPDAMSGAWGVVLVYRAHW